MNKKKINNNNIQRNMKYYRNENVKKAKMWNLLSSDRCEAFEEMTDGRKGRIRWGRIIGTKKKEKKKK